MVALSVVVVVLVVARKKKVVVLFCVEYGSLLPPLPPRAHTSPRPGGGRRWVGAALWWEMSAAGVPLEVPLAADGPLLASATSALQELVASVNSARGDMADRTAAAQAEITAQLQGTREAASNAFRDATEIVDEALAECKALQKQVERETEQRVAAEAERARGNAERDAAKSDLQACRTELEGSRQREESRAAELEAAREELRQLRLGAESGADAHPDRHGGDLETANAALQLAHAESERLKKQIEQLDDRVEKEVQARAEVEALARAQMEELAQSTAFTNDARVEMEKIKQRQREADEQRNTAQAEVKSLRRELMVQQAQHIEALEAEQAVHDRERASLRDVVSPPVRGTTSVDDAAQSIEYELQKLRTEHEQQLAIMKRDADALKQEVERKHNTLLTMHSAVEIMREEHESFRESTQRDWLAVDAQADLTRETESLKQQLELSHKQLQLAMQSTPVPVPEEPDQLRFIQLEQDLSHERAIKEALEKELQAAQHKQQVHLESADRRHAAEVEAIKLKIKAAQDDALALVQEKDHLQQTVEAMNQTIADKQAERDEAHQKLLQTEAELASTAANHADTQQRHATQVQEHREREKQLQEEADMLADEKASLERHASEVDRALKENQANMMDERHELERREEDLRAEAEQQVGAWRKKHEDLQQAHQDLQTHLQTTQDQLRTEQDTHARTASERDAIKGQHANLFDEHQAVLQERDQSRVEHAEAVAAHAEAAAARDALRAQYTELSSEHKSVSDQLTQKIAHFQTLESELQTAHQKGADAHRAHEDAKARADDEIKLISSAAAASESTLQTVQQELDDHVESNRRMNEDLVATMEERERVTKELGEEKDAHYQTKEHAAVELAESKHALADEVRKTKDEAMQQLAEAKRASEEGYAILQERFNAQVSQVEALKEEHAKIQARWENDRTEWEEDRKELGSVHEQSLARYEDAIELAERHNLEAKTTAAQHSSLIHDHTEASEEVDKLRSTLEAMSKELTEAQNAHAAATAELDAHREKGTELSAAHEREVEHIKDEAQESRDTELAAHRKASSEAAAQLHSEHEEAIAQHRAQYAALSAQHTVQQQQGQELAARVEECQAQVRAHEEAKAQLHDTNEKLSAELDEHRLQQMELEHKLAAAEDSATESSAVAAQEVQQANAEAAQEVQQANAEAAQEVQQARAEAEQARQAAEQARQAAEQAHTRLEAEAERLQTELAAAEANLTTVQQESVANRRSDMDRLTASLTIAHDNLKRLEEERVEQAHVMEMKEKELSEWRGRALGGENALLRSASQALALSEGQSISKPDAEATGSRGSPGSKGSPTLSVAASVASVGSRPRRGSWGSDAGKMVYECELGTGFRGTLEEVKDHEARIRKMREDTKKDLAMARSPTRTSLSAGSYAMAGATATAVVSASDSRYVPRATAARPASSPLLAPAATYSSSSSRYPEEDAYGARRSSSIARGEVSARSTDARFAGDSDAHGSSRADALASKAAARHKRWASASTTSRAPRREPGATSLSEAEPPATHNARRSSLLGPPRTPSGLGAEDRD